MNKITLDMYVLIFAKQNEKCELKKKNKQIFLCICKYKLA